MEYLVSVLLCVLVFVPLVNKVEDKRCQPNGSWHEQRLWKETDKCEINWRVVGWKMYWVVRSGEVTDCELRANVGLWFAFGCLWDLLRSNTFWKMCRGFRFW